MPFNIRYSHNNLLLGLADTIEEAREIQASQRDLGVSCVIEADVGRFGPVSTRDYNRLHGEVAIKHDQVKPDYSLLPLADLEGLVSVLAYGAKKYTRNNWKQGGGHDPNRLIAACLRHLAAYQEGQLVDEESGLSHISHAACNLVFLMRQIRLTKVKT